ncbi:MAG: ABC transporter ATP-binding protein [Paracoccaceae bacterium]
MRAPGPGGAAIALERCARRFPGGVTALRPTELSVRTGEVLALLGPSGCGKTTLLRLVAGLERPDPGGVVRFDGEDVTAEPIERRRVGMVFQSHALFPNMTVRRNVGYALEVRRHPRAEIAARVDEVMALCRIGELAERRPHELSGGQAQRVALARAVAMRPRALLLDEPLSALDASLREALRDELAGLLRTLSITAVFVTHDQGEAMAVADRVAVMNAGRVLQVDAPRRLRAAPADAFVASFVGGASPLAGRLSDGWLHLAGGRLPAPAHATPEAAFFVRPEALSPAGPAEAALRGHVLRAVFLGDRTRVMVGGIADAPVAVDAPPEFDAAPGSPIGLAARPDALIATRPAVPEADP